jgi:hypothetical protein
MIHHPTVQHLLGKMMMDAGIIHAPEIDMAMVQRQLFQRHDFLGRQDQFAFLIGLGHSQLPCEGLLALSVF